VILRSPVYIGRTVYAKARYSEIGKKKGRVQRAEADRIVVEGAVPTIVPRELWDAAQARHGTRKFGVGRSLASALPAERPDRVRALPQAFPGSETDPGPGRRVLSLWRLHRERCQRVRRSADRDDVPR
jgi:hypothetical protein